ncbi:MAG: NfeD family protein [Candidatus Thiodiazotropha sp. (ex Lucinoma borealis)]|nr:NfeD family protein [Candidatus Thiodiazotropha sp. (ex Lucinoma borealis)]
MSFHIVYWHWVTLGIGLMLLEIALPSFTALWIGAAAVIVGALLFFLPDLSVTLQVVLWTVLSTALAWLWFKYLKPLSIDKTKAGLSREAIIGEVGQVLSVPNEERRGTLRFPAPILGADEWKFIAEDSLAVGDRVRVIDLSGNSLIVTKS